MRHALLWMLLLGLSLAVVVLASGNGQSTIGDLTTGDFASLLVNVAWLVLIAGVLIALFRERLTKALEAGVLWIVIALLLMLGYTYRFQLHDIADQVMAELVPGRIADSGRTVALWRALSRADFQIAPTSTATTSDDPRYRCEFRGAEQRGCESGRPAGRSDQIYRALRPRMVTPRPPK